MWTTFGHAGKEEVVNIFRGQTRPRMICLLGRIESDNRRPPPGAQHCILRLVYCMVL